jgi:hypothetical protein
MKSIITLLAITLVATSGIVPAIIPAIGYYGLIPTFAQSVTPTFTGRAVGLAVSDPLTGTTTFADTGNLTECGMADPGGAIGVGNLLASANVNLAFTVGCPDNVQSEVVASNIGLGSVQIDFIRAATITSLGCPPTATTVFEIGPVSVAGVPIDGITTEPNQVIAIPGVGTLSLNEQINTPNGITQIAAHLSTETATEIIVGQTSSIINCTTSTSSYSVTSPDVVAFGLLPIQQAFAQETSSVASPDVVTFGLLSIPLTIPCGLPPWTPPCDNPPPSPPPTTPPTECTKTTGGGFIAGKNPAVANGKANFGFNARPNLNGHLNYQDHTMLTQFHVKLDQQETWACLDKCPDSDSPFDGVLNAREFGGPGSINGETGYFIDVCVEDNGEPGNEPKGSDFFDIEIFSGVVSIYDNQGRLEGGNIQVHRN